MTGVGLAALALLGALAALVLALGDRSAGHTAATSTQRGNPVAARPLLEPRTLLFGDTVRAVVDLTVDRAKVDPDSVNVSADFTPWSVFGTPVRTRRDAGTTSHLQVAYTLRCLTSPCIPSGQAISLELPRASVTFADRDGNALPEEALRLTWPRLLVYSRTSISVAETRGSVLPWRADLLSLPAASYRVPPLLAVSLALLGSVLLALATGVLVLRAWPRRAPAPLPEPEPPPELELSPLEQALVLLEDAQREDGSADRRRALELIAEEFAERETSIARAAQVLAWSEAMPLAQQTRELAAQVREVVALEEPGPAEIEEAPGDTGDGDHGT